MTPRAKAEFEAVLEGILAKSDDDLLRLLEEAEAGVYGDVRKAIFMPISSTVSVSSNAQIGTAIIYPINNALKHVIKCGTATRWETLPLAA